MSVDESRRNIIKREAADVSTSLLLKGETDRFIWIAQKEKKYYS